MGKTVGKNSSPSQVRNFNGVQNETMDGVAGRTANPTSRRIRIGAFTSCKTPRDHLQPHFLTVPPDFASSLDETGAEGRTGESEGLPPKPSPRGMFPRRRRARASAMARGCTPSRASTQPSARNQLCCVSVNALSITWNSDHNR